ncbi:hypothetical protein [Streptomyces sp. SID3343]|uniref:hypothetical protein n=1 Tax=Streptomyces sp. SID3343 TaxID=2690260 RepID=UPI00137024C1|nr:hypothetical protein [Streptomyces sp. SID3343]MYW02325.1 hypothetical protein [Streptomyces sp. SID3343]
MTGVPNLALTRILRELSWGPRDLARAVNSALGKPGHISPTAPFKWRDQGCVPGGVLPQVIATVLGAAAERDLTCRDLWPDRTWPQDRAVLSTDGLTGPWEPETTLEALSVVAHDVNRRSILAASGAVLLTPLQHWFFEPARAQAAIRGRRVDAALVDGIDQIIDTKRRLDDTLGGGMLYDSVRGELRLVLTLLKNSTYTEDIERRLYAAAAELARLGGWACVDAGHDGAAQRYFNAALRAAHQSGDRALGANILGFMGVQATRTGDPRDAVTLLTSAHAGAAGTLTPTVRAALLGRLARAHGRLGNTHAVQAAADDAFALLAKGRPEDDPPWIYWATTADLAGMVGEAYAYLGDTERAEENLRHAIETMDPQAHPRDRVLLLIRLAELHLTGDVDRACAIATEALTAAEGLDSERVITDLASFRTHLAPHRGSTAAADFDARSAPLFQTN